MKATEFRIGNLAREITHSKNEVVKVSVRHFEDIENNEIDLFPVHLTQEWLKDLGFKKPKNDHCFIDCEAFQVYIIPDKGGRYANDGKALFCQGVTPWYAVECKYVHQLQNLYFALKREELTIK